MRNLVQKVKQFPCRTAHLTFSGSHIKDLFSVVKLAQRGVLGGSLLSMTFINCAVDQPTNLDRIPPPTADQLPPPVHSLTFINTECPQNALGVLLTFFCCESLRIDRPRVGLRFFLDLPPPMNPVICAHLKNLDLGGHVETEHELGEFTDDITLRITINVLEACRGSLTSLGLLCNMRKHKEVEKCKGILDDKGKYLKKLRLDLTTTDSEIVGAGGVSSGTCAIMVLQDR